MNDKRTPENRLDGMHFGEALERFTQTDPKEVAVVSTPAMADEEIENLISLFEDAAHVDEDGVEFWSARELMTLLDYKKWENFERVLDKAMASCKTLGLVAENHFQEVFPDVGKNPEGGRPAKDFRLNRYACYLVTQNGNPRFKPVAFGQSYFAIQTRRQELSDARAVPASEDEKRVFLRNQIKEHNRYLSSAAKEAGVITPKDFAIFHSMGYQGLYGKTVPAIRKYKGLPLAAEILDRMGSTELAANFFRVTQTEVKLRKEGIKGKQKAYNTHFEVGRQVRDAMLKISGVAPEDLPAVDSIKQAEKRLRLANEEPCLPTASEMPLKIAEEQRPIDLKRDLWKYALLVMATKDNGEISTSDLISELPTFIQVPDGSQEVLSGRKDSKFSQIVRNLKSHKTAKTNFIYQGFAEAIPDGFRITERGREFVKDYFSR